MELDVHVTRLALLISAKSFETFSACSKCEVEHDNSANGKLEVVLLSGDRM